MHVMIVDADKHTASEINAALSGCGCRITSASTPEDCLRLAARQAFDLVLLDLSLTRPDRCEDLIRQIRSAQPDVKIISIAAQCDRDLERVIRRHGVLFYMTKPVSPNLIRELATHLLKSMPTAETAPGSKPANRNRNPREPGARRTRRGNP
jgi:two-component system NtrC family response regulator/two-component system response regulator HydG